MKNIRFFHSSFFLLVCFLLFLLTACGSTATATGNHPTPTGKKMVVTQKQTQSADGTPSAQGNTTPTTTTVAMPATQTSCPADGTARPAVMRTLALGTDPSVVYVYNDVPQNTSISYGILKRYDPANGQKKVIVTSGLSIDQAQVSADGQWVLFSSQIDPRADAKHGEALQLVRLDGSGLQTLYCSPQGEKIGASIEWSTNQQFIAFDRGAEVDLLNTATGSVQTELTTGNEPLVLRFWLDNTHLYLTHLIDQSGPIYLLDISKGPHQTVSNLTTVLEGPSFLDFDSSYDGRKLYVATSLHAQQGSISAPSRITVQPATGGQAQRIYSSSVYAVTQVRAITPTTLLFLIENVPLAGQQADTSHNGLWKMNTDGSGMTRLTPTIGQTIGLNDGSQFPWSNVSRDGSLYSLLVVANQGKALYIGSLKGGEPTEFASTSSGSVFIAGWTTM